MSTIALRRLVPLAFVLIACGDEAKQADPTDASTTTATETSATTATSEPDATTPPDDTTVATDATSVTTTDATETPTDATTPTDVTTPTDATTDTSDVTPGESCVDFCHEDPDPERACQCDLECMARGDCCADYCDVCPFTEDVCNGAFTLCEHRGCDPFHVDGLPCACDAGCEQRDDCCEDYQEFCGAPCEDTCIAGPGENASCATGACVKSCKLGFDDCDAQAPGCEAELAVDALNCGTCDHACDGGPFAEGVCAGGECILACDAGRDACDTNTLNGCETRTDISEDNCGVCGVSCPAVPNAAPECDGGSCGAICDAGYEDCNGDDLDGCESDLQNSETSCGACARVCGPAETCVTGGCSCTGTFAYTAPTPFNSTAIDLDGFDFGLGCGISATSLNSLKVTVVGTSGAKLPGTLSLPDPNRARWTPTVPKHLRGGDAIDITIGAGLRSFDNLKAAAYRVVQGRVAATAEGSGAFIASGSAVAGDFYLYGRFALADFDGDGDADLATPIGLYMNDGSGTFGARARTFDTNDVYARDLNADGFADLVLVDAAAGADSSIDVAWGAATNALSTTSNVTSIGFSEKTPAFGDLDGDGDLDLIVSVSNGSGSGATVFKTESGSPPGFTQGGGVGGDVGRATMLDVDRDGDLDAVLGNYAFERAWLNNGSAVFSDSGTTYGTNNAYAVGIASGDIDGDGYADVVVTNATGNDNILKGTAAGGFTTTTGVSSDAGPTELADVDGDHDLDIVTVLSGKIAIYQNNGAGDFSGGSTSITTSGFALADIDGDGDIDLANRQGTGVTFYRNVCGGADCTCGNNAINGAEACDEGPDGSPFCDPDCSLVDCGDFLVNEAAGEECDDGNDDDSDDCRNNCKSAKCDDGVRNGDETDVDCGGSCGDCGALAHCQSDLDCDSLKCLGSRCAYLIDFEDGVMPAELSTSGAAQWAITTERPLSGTRSLLSGAVASGRSSAFLTIAFDKAGSIGFTFQANFFEPNDFDFFLDGVAVMQVHGRRMPDVYGDTRTFYVSAGSHTFEWRYQGATADTTDLVLSPYNRMWVDDILVVNGAPE